MGLFADGQFGIAAFQCEVPGGDTDEAYHHAEQ